MGEQNCDRKGAACMEVRRYIGNRAFYRRLFTIMLPILVQNVITNFVSLLDNVMVGQVGTEPMSGVAIVNQLLIVFNLCIFGGLAGAGIFTAQYYGSRNHRGVADTFRAKLYIAAAAAIAFIALFLLFGETLILQFIHEGGEKLDLAATLVHARAYLRIMLFQIPPFALQMAYASTLRETGETLVPMNAGITAVLVNLVLNYILIFGKLGAPALGVEGAAIATVIARYVECAIILIWTHRHRAKNPFLDTAYTTFRIPGELLRKIAVKGLPLLINELLWSSGVAILNQCYSMRGLEVVSAVNISSTVSNLFFCAFLSMGNAIAIIVGQLLGAGELERAVDEDRKLIAFSVALCAGVGVIMAFLAPLAPRLYNTSDNVRRIAAQLLLVVAVSMPLHAFTNSCYFTLRAGGQVLITFVFDSLYQWTLVLPLAFVLSRFTALPILPMYIAVQCMEFTKCFLGYYLVKRRKWVRDLVNGSA